MPRMWPRRPLVQRQPSMRARTGTEARTASRRGESEYTERRTRKRSDEAAFSPRGPVGRTDPNPIIYEGAPRSTGGLLQARALCDAMGIELQVEKPREYYVHGWGHNCSDAKSICCSRNLTVMDSNSHPVTLSFDLVDDNSPLIVGMDFRQYSDTWNMHTPSTMTFRRPHDVRVYKMYTYIADDEEGN